MTNLCEEQKYQGEENNVEFQSANDGIFGCHDDISLRWFIQQIDQSGSYGHKQQVIGYHCQDYGIRCVNLSGSRKKK